MDKKILIISIIVVLVIAVAAVAAWYVTQDDDKDNNDNNAEESTDVSVVAKNFCDSYKGNFGVFNVADGATADKATATKTNEGSQRMSHSDFIFTVSDNAKGLFDDMKATMTAAKPIMGASPTEVTGIDGFDGCYAYKYDVHMGTMTFSMIHFAGYVGDVFVDGNTAGLYHPGSVAPNEDILGIYNAVANAFKA